MLDFQVSDFWDWFSKYAALLQPAKYDTAFLAHIDHTISSWGFTWEVGPGLLKENSFTISPGGKKELLGETDKIVAKAPQLDNWEFYSWKQPKENWSMAKLDGRMEIDASRWTYVLLKYPDDKTEILIKADNLKAVETNRKELAVDLVLTHLIGEKRKIEEIDFIDIVDQFDSSNGVTQLHFLPAHLDRLKNDSK